MRSCIVCSIPYNPSTSEEISFHRFPKDESLKNTWIKVCQIEEAFKKVKDAVICSQHFQLSDYYQTRLPQKILLKESVPSQMLTINKKSDNLPNLKNTNFHIPENDPPCSSGQYKLSVQADARYIGDLQPHNFNSPRKAKRHINMIRTYVDEQKQQIKKLKTENTKLIKKINNLENLIEHLVEKNLLAEESQETVMDSVPDAIKNILMRQLASKSAKFTPELRTFALTLNFYSPRAYSYVRSTFSNLLPHPATINKWYSAVNGDPGFTEEAFEAIKWRVANCNDSKTIMVNLVLDEMAIRQRIEYSGDKFHGYVELGIRNDRDCVNTTEATNALVIMAVALNENWKVPVGYFLIKSLRAQERADILNRCLTRLQDTGAKCHSITFDGASVNISMCKILGANYGFENFKPYFPHPVTNKPVYTFYDACHMLKLCRNAFGDKEVLYDLNNFRIEWKYIKQLVELQQTEGLRAANKLTKRHVNYQNEIMKVFLAAQTLSASVASSLCFCKRVAKGFENCEATANFCLIFNNLFDILNCRNKYSKGEFCQPINDSNYEFLDKKIQKYVNYLKNLKNNSGTLLIESNRKTGFLGFVVNCTNLLNLYKDLKSHYKFEYILSFKLSQDHLETFFSAVRSRSGFNNNPSCLQFKAAYKRLIVKHEISGSKYGNCSILDAASILHVSSGTKSKTTDTILDEDLAEFELKLNLENDGTFFTQLSLSQFIEDVVVYISGFVIKKVKPIITCHICCSKLTSSEYNSKLIKFKNRGKLILPSKDVILLCLQLERAIRITDNAKLLTKKNLKELLTLQAIRNLPDLFGDEMMVNHIKKQSLMDNHRIQLIKLISTIYLNVRIHYECRKQTDHKNTGRLRQKCVKLILFRNE